MPLFIAGGGVCACVETLVVRDGANMPIDISSPPSSHLTWGDRCGELTHFGGEEMSRIFLLYWHLGPHVNAHTQTHTCMSQKDCHHVNGCWRSRYVSSCLEEAPDDLRAHP